jgi:putative spermidine/putrescine transport system ATP-binding protein
MGSHIAFQSLRLEKVGRTFGAMNALQDLTLEIKRGEFIALLGPSGCGKSTALNCIAGLLSTTSGAIWLDDVRIDTLAVEDRGFGMVFQNYALFPHMTVRSNIGFGLRMRGIAKAELEKRVDAAIRTVRLESQAHKLPGQLSGGQQQRVAIARAIAIDPPLVLMDEPLSNLDAKLRLEMRQEIRRIHQDLGGVTIYVTHDQDEALSLADRIVVLRDGMIRQVGTPEDLYLRPAHIDVAEFMGFRNRLEGTLIGGGQVQPMARASADFGGTVLEGVALHSLSGSAVTAAIRPENLTPVDSKLPGIDANVEAFEYRGRDFFGTARTQAGVELFFRSEVPLHAGEEVRLSADPSKILIYRGGEA